jgi:hypothetical protein
MATPIRANYPLGLKYREFEEAVLPDAHCRAGIWELLSRISAYYSMAQQAEGDRRLRERPEC